VILRTQYTKRRLNDFNVSTQAETLRRVEVLVTAHDSTLKQQLGGWQQKALVATHNTTRDGMHTPAPAVADSAAAMTPEQV
jgi:hypothetical protein